MIPGLSSLSVSSCVHIFTEYICESAHRTVNAGKQFTVKFDQRVGRSFYFLLSDLSQFSFVEVEDDYPPLFWFSLIGVNQRGADDVVSVAVLAQFSRDEAGRTLVGHQLMCVKN